jgi:hypothetical protein
MALERLQRALTQRLYILDFECIGDDGWKFTVQGTQGTLYDVKISRAGVPSCTCPDFVQRNARNRAASDLHMCKHAFITAVRALRQPATCALDYTQLPEACEEHARWRAGNTGGLVISNPGIEIQTTHTTTGRRVREPEPEEDFKPEVERRPLEVDELCSICLTDLEPDGPFCRWSCGRSFHADCLDVWRRRKNTCPLCRHELNKPEQRNVKRRI